MNENPYVLKIDLPGRKSKKFEKPYYAYIGGDAINAINNWREHRPYNTKAIFTDQFGNPISKKALELYWMRHLRKLGIVKLVTGSLRFRSGKNLHEIRDVFRSQWEKSSAKSSVAEFLMGHTVDPLEYNKSFRDEKWTKREYEKALPFLQIISSGRPFGQIDEDTVEYQATRIMELENEVQRLQGYHNSLGKLTELLDTPDKLEKFKKLLEE